MNSPAFRDWQSVREEVLRRIHAREWRPGALIPSETDLAREFGCARTTVNRALRSLAESGLLDRRRKAGTRIAAQPVAKARLDIAVIRKEVEERGQAYGYRLISRQVGVPPAGVSDAMKVSPSRRMIHIYAVHTADGTPYAVEDRWIDTGVVPGALAESFVQLSANEWLLANVPYTHGEISFSAQAAGAQAARALECADHSALFVIDRLTWDGASAITKVRLLFGPGYTLRTQV